MKHKSKIAAIVILSIIVLGAALFFLWEHLTDYSTALEINWGISLPSQASLSEVYAKTSGSSFHGDGIRYHVFTYQDAASVASMLDWKTEEQETNYDGAYSHAVTAWLDAIEVPAEYRTDCSDCLFWYQAQADHSELLVLWDRETGTLYVLESFL